jgi:biotin-dependent carboxylase-like uncharacterized protein
MLECLAPGLRSTVQDEGRPGLAHLGVSVAGAADRLAHAAANLLAGAPPGAAALEMTLAGPTFAVVEGGLIGLAGADMGVHVPEEGRRLRPGASHRLRAGTTLVLGEATDGARAYLALEGGIAAPRVLGSASLDPVAGFGGAMGRPLAPGDVLRPVRAGAARASRRRERAWPGPGPSSGVTADATAALGVVPGPHRGLFAPDALDALAGAWVVSARSDRAGVRLDGWPVVREGIPEPVSLPMIPGAVQVPASGLPIVLGPDGPTVGGYPTPACVITADLAVLGQLRPGDRVRLAWLEVGEARERLRAQRAALAAAAALLA